MDNTQKIHLRQARAHALLDLDPDMVTAHTGSQFPAVAYSIVAGELRHYLAALVAIIDEHVPDARLCDALDFIYRIVCKHCGEALEPADPPTGGYGWQHAGSTAITCYYGAEMPPGARIALAEPQVPAVPGA